jgi:hypothetical protein
LVGSPVARAAEEVDLLLVLSSDVSRSIDAPKFKLQRDGYAAAIANPHVIQAMRSGAIGKIAISFMEWSGVEQQKIVISWTVIRDEATAKEFSAQIIQAPRAFFGLTSISSSIDFAMAQLARAPFHANRHTIDISGDGTQNCGLAVIDARDEAVAEGWRVTTDKGNRLARRSDRGQLPVSSLTGAGRRHLLNTVISADELGFCHTRCERGANALL